MSFFGNLLKLGSQKVGNLGRSLVDSKAGRLFKNMMDKNPEIQKDLTDNISKGFQKN